MSSKDIDNHNNFQNEITGGQVNQAGGDINVNSKLNQTIGQVYGGMVVYVSGGQTIVNSHSVEKTSAEANKLEIGPNPYKGLQAFYESDKDSYFGRSAQVKSLWSQFRELYERDESVRLLPIYGPSGSGKSSLVRAGLIPELAARPLPGLAQARIAVLKPETEPLQSLAKVLARIAENDLSPVKKTREFSEELALPNPKGSYDGLQRIARVLPQSEMLPLIVVIDQFEEIYSLCKNSVTRNAFVENLLYAAGDCSKYVSVILTMRNDFMGETHQHPRLGCLFSDQGFLVPPMDEAALREAIAQPAENAGHSLDEATIRLLIEQTLGREGALPMLQFALTRIWQGLVEGIAAAITLEKIGGVGGSLAGEAQRIYDSLNDADKAIAQRLFLGLVQLGEGTKDTRRRVEINSLVAATDTPDQFERVVERFTSPGVRLVTLSAEGEMETAEVTHEALFDHWQLLNSWINSGRDDIRFQRRLEEAANDWDNQDRPVGSLWRSPNLDTLKDFHKRRGKKLTELEACFFEASCKEEKQSKLSMKKTNKMLQRRLNLLRVAFALSLIVGGHSIYQLRRAEKSRMLQYDVTAKAFSKTDPSTSLINGIAAVGLERSWFLNFLRISEVEIIPDSFLAEMVNLTDSDVLTFDSDIIYDVAISPDNKRFVSASADKTLRIWDGKGNPIGTTLNGHLDEVNTVAFSHDGETIISGSDDGRLRRWDKDGSPIGPALTGHSEPIYDLAISPDDKRIVSASLDHTVRIWDENGNAVGGPLNGHSDDVNTVAFSPDGETIVSGSEDGTLRRWDKNGTPIGSSIDSSPSGVYVLTYSPNGKHIITGNRDGSLQVWDSSLSSPPMSFQAHAGEVYEVDVSPGNQFIASAGSDGFVKLWDMEGNPIGEPIAEHVGYAAAVQFSPDGKFILSSGSDKTIRSSSLSKVAGDSFEKSTYPAVSGFIWDLALSPDEKRIISANDNGTLQFGDNRGVPIGSPFGDSEYSWLAAEFSPDGEIIAAGNHGGMLQLWDKDGKPTTLPWKGHDGMVFSVKFSPDGKYIASAGEDSTIRLWDRNGNPVGKAWRGHTDEVNSIAFNPDGDTVVSASDDETLRLWDMDGNPVGDPLSGHLGEVYTVEFSPDGQFIASAGEDQIIYLWDREGNPVSQSLETHKEAISKVMFTPDGKQVISASQDATIQTWRWKKASNASETVVSGLGDIYAFAISSDGDRLIVANGDGTISSQKFSNSILALACNKANFTDETEAEKVAKRMCQRHVWSKE